MQLLVMKALSLRWFPDAYANLVHAYLCLCDWQGRNAQFKLTNILTKQLESTRIVPPNTAVPCSDAIF